MLILVTERTQLVYECYILNFQMPYRRQGEVEKDAGSGDDYWDKSSFFQNTNVNNCRKQ